MANGQHHQQKQNFQYDHLALGQCASLGHQISLIILAFAVCDVSADLSLALIESHSDVVVPGHNAYSPCDDLF